MHLLEIRQIIPALSPNISVQLTVYLLGKPDGDAFHCGKVFD